MKNYHLLWIGLLFVTLISCNDFDNTFDFAPKVQFSVADTTVTEGNITIPIVVQLVGPHNANPITVGFETSGNAQEGINYRLSVDRSVTLSPNTSEVTFNLELLDNAVFEGDTTTLVLTITSATEGIGVGREGEDRKQFTVTILEDECPIDWLSGTFSVTTTDINPANCGTINNTVTITQINDNTYEISDLTGGVYKNCFSRADNPGQFTIEGNTVLVEDQPDVVFTELGQDFINGEGELNTCAQTFTLTWSNGFGDRGTSRFTRQ